MLLLRATTPPLLSQLGRESRISDGGDSSAKAQIHERRTRFTTVRMQLAIHTEFPARLIESINDKVEIETYEPGEVVLQMRQQSVGLIFVKEGRLQVVANARYCVAVAQNPAPSLYLPKRSQIIRSPFSSV